MAREYWDVRDRAGLPLGYEKERGEPFLEGEHHLMMELWLVDDFGRLLLQKRAPEKRVLPNTWSMTTGCMTAGENSRTGCRREALEELGIALEDRDLLFLDRLVHGSGLWDVYAARVNVSSEALCLQAGEVSEARWFTPEEFLRLCGEGPFYCYGELKEIFKKVQSQLPAVR